MPCFGNYLLRNADWRPDDPAVISEEGLLTYRQLNQESNRLANALRKRGIHKGSRVALLMKSSAQWVLSWYACQKLGAAVIPLHARLLPQEHARIIALADASCVIYCCEYGESAGYIEKKCEGVHLFVQQGPGSSGPDSKICFDTLISEADCREAQVELNGSEAAVILFTSGTTGMPKGVMRTQKMICNHAEQLAMGNVSGNRHEVMLTPAPLYHTAGLFCIFKTAALGGTLILINGFDPQKICEMTEKYSATQLLLVPPISYQRLYNSGYPKKYRLSSVNLALVTAGKCTDECIREMFEMFPNAAIRPSWGSTETSSCTGANLTREELKEFPERMRTIGKLNPFVEIRIVDENGRDTPVGTAGEAWVRSPMVFKGYLGDPELSEKCFDGDWFKTEDIIKMDEHGYYYLLDRKRDIVKTGGENVYAQEIERVLQNYSAILDCAVIGVPDARFGEAIAAAVTLNEGASFSTEEFLAFCKTRLPSFKKPRYLAVMDKLPTNDVGKVQKGVLRRDAQKLFSRIC